MTNVPAVLERDADTGPYVGCVPGFPGRTAGTKRWMNCANPPEVVETLLEDGSPQLAKSPGIAVSGAGCIALTLNILE